MEKIFPELPSLFLMPADLVKQMHSNQKEIMDKLNYLKTDNTVMSEYITTMELRIHRSKFDELRHQNLIKTIEKGCKIYVPATEIRRYKSTQALSAKF